MRSPWGIPFAVSSSRPSPVRAVETLEAAVMQQINMIRREHGLIAVKMNAALADAWRAQNQSAGSSALT